MRRTTPMPAGIAAFALALTLTGCSGDRQCGTDAGRNATEIVPETLAEVEAKPPTIEGLLLRTGVANDLTLEITFSTDSEARGVVRVETDNQQLFEVTETQLATQHRIPVAGLHAETDYVLQVTAVAEDGQEAQAVSLTHKTAPLPDDMPPVEVITAQHSQMAPGFTLFNVGRWTFLLDLGWSYVVAVDTAGLVVWYERLAHMTEGVQRLPTGELAYIRGYESVVVKNWMGEVVDEYLAEDLGLDTFHHGLTQISDGDLLLLSTECRLIDDYETPDGKILSLNVVGDVVVRMTREGQIVRTWKLLDLLDPYTYTDDFLVPFWDLVYVGKQGGTKDWSHGNGVFWSDADGTFVVTLAAQNSVVKIAPDEGEVVWHLGNKGNLALEGDGLWPVRPHAGKPMGVDRILLADNGDGTVAHPLRAVEYHLTALSGTQPVVSESWASDGGQPRHGLGPADADYLDNGNVLFVQGGLVVNDDLPPLHPDNEIYVRILEMQREPDTHIVFEAVIRDTISEHPVKYISTGAEHLATLYPPGCQVQYNQP